MRSKRYPADFRRAVPQAVINTQSVIVGYQAMLSNSLQSQTKYDILDGAWTLVNIVKRETGDSNVCKGPNITLLAN